MLKCCCGVRTGFWPSERHINQNTLCIIIMNDSCTSICDFLIRRSKTWIQQLRNPPIPNINMKPSYPTAIRRRIHRPQYLPSGIWSITGSPKTFRRRPVSKNSESSSGIPRSWPAAMTWRRKFRKPLRPPAFWSSYALRKWRNHRNFNNRSTKML